MKKTVNTLAALTITAGLGVVAATSTAAPASAADGQVGQRETVCADDLAVRQSKVGAWSGSLTRGQTFDVEQVDGQWVYGFAYGHVNRKGWVQQGWFC